MKYPEKLLVNLTEEQKRALRIAAADAGMSMGQYIREHAVGQAKKDMQNMASLPADTDGR